MQGGEDAAVGSVLQGAASHLQHRAQPYARQQRVHGEIALVLVNA